MPAFVVIDSANMTSAGCVWTIGAATIHQPVATLSKSLFVYHTESTQCHMFSSINEVVDSVHLFVFDPVCVCVCVV